MKKVVFIAIFAFFNVFYVAASSLKQSFEEQVTPQAPNYSLEKYWSALPWRIDTPDEVPNENYKNKQDIAVVDVFFCASYHYFS